MRALCATLGEPQTAYHSIHVAGSKGKGSVSIMLARVLAGVRRRGRVVHEPAPPAVEGEDQPRRRRDAGGASSSPQPPKSCRSSKERSPPIFRAASCPTYFELTTLIAFCAFRKAGCDFAVIETGLGGRLDSTNVVAPQASVITPIELEHTEWLGDTIELIAAEKAGIIKPGAPCYLSRQRPEARQVFVRTCIERLSPLREAPVLAIAREAAIDIFGTSAKILFATDSPLAARFPDGIAARTPMIGAIQAENMVLALLAAGETVKSMNLGAAQVGLERAFLPARFELVSRDPPIILDGAHTPASVGLALRHSSRFSRDPKPCSSPAPRTRGIPRWRQSSRRNSP